ncbi:hypothetical protein ACIBG7_05815 [Nonomuraea sp. NPDC050328]|uniref:hypothetical protein n=1 Tax=Nonomuraea sp. NPDC050328 TaxID=3364361 RepID=UPI0037B7DFBA
MITMTPVLDPWFDNCPFWLTRQGQSALPVPRHPTPQQVGDIMWALIGRTVTQDDLSITATTAPEAIETYLTTSDDDTHAAGGLRITSADTVIDPGCCVGLDEWRDWIDALNDQPVFLGHNPDVWLEIRGPILRLRQDNDGPQPGKQPDPSEQYIDIPREALPALLQGVRQDLTGFLAALHPWAHDLAPKLADQLVQTVDRRLEISAPLPV